MKKNESTNETEIDLLQLARALWKRAWAIVLAALILGGAAFAYTKLAVTPLYEAQTLMYVNNKNGLNGNQVSISSSDIAASQRLVDTYTIILKTRETLDEVIRTAGLPYSYEELVSMITAEAVNDTETFYVRVTHPDPQAAADIANAIGQVLPGKITAIVDGSSVRVVDHAVAPRHPSSPRPVKNAVLGALLGILIVSAIVVIRELMDSQVHSSDYLTQNYDIPVLAVIPDLVSQPQTGKGGRSHD